MLKSIMTYGALIFAGWYASNKFLGGFGWVSPFHIFGLLVPAALVVAATRPSTT